MRVLCSSLLLVLLFTAPAAAETITLVADEWCPYNCVPETDAPGYMVEIAQKAFGDAGHDVKYETLNWARAVADARTGAYVGIIGAAKTDAEDFVYPEVALGQDDSLFFVRKGHPWKYAGIDSLRDQRVGVIRGYSYGDEIDKYLEELGESEHVQIASGDSGMETNIRKLMAERIDVVIANPFVFRSEAQKMGLLDKIESAGAHGVPTLLYIGVSPAHPKAAEYAELLSKTVQQMRASGELATLLAKYGLEDWEK